MTIQPQPQWLIDLSLDGGQQPANDTSLLM